MILIQWNEVEVGCFSAALDMVFIGGAGGFGMFGAEFGIREVEVLGGFEEAEILFHVGKRPAFLELLKDVRLDGGTNGAEKRIGILFVTNVGGGGELGEERAGGFGIGAGVETAKGGAGGVEVESAFEKRFGEEFDDFGVAVARAEIENVFAVRFRKFGELVFL